VEAIAIVTGLALIQVFLFSFQVGQARVKYGVSAPAMSGNSDFERSFRVHQNTVEQVVIFIPALWMFGYYVHPMTGAALGLVFFAARFVYRSSYLKDPKSRSRGFGIGAAAMSVLLLGGMIGAAMSWF
jgi:glutathione S-transferase